ncbi:major facilitator superfamily protein [Hirsutella rhossiliensis]|uniref:Sugar transporter domain-containing protein n=1 Tax=Hirsutella rhossiliensis TaxID=111463 RepID=A0A9P8MWD8_9HYPO|nr:sugar transporter domain-containing protein [Hirsutella rhossiliensis]KAH0962257.1 sugar transporter domain-containing protein [Hirsutella rhossiliensis]
MARFNLYYAMNVFIIAGGSIPKGYDEGGFAAASGLDSFLNDFHLARSGRWTSASSPAQLASRRAVVTSLGVLGAAAGAVVACLITDRIGRLRAWQAFAVLWMTGFFAATFASGNLGLLLFARIWGGVGAGGLTVVAPLYLAEIARTSSRGMIVSVYMVILLSFLMVGFFVNYAVVMTLPSTREQYRVVLAVPQIPVGLMLIASIRLKDTPRWLAYKGKKSEAAEALALLRGLHENDPEVTRELQEIQRQISAEDQLLGDASTWTIVKEVATEASYRRRFLLGVLMQTVAQWSGGNGITYYIPEIFRLAGVTSKRNSLVTAGSYGATKLIFTVIFTWGLIDYFGRRRCFMTGLALQFITHVYMAIYMALWRDSGNRAASDAAVASVFVYAVGWSIGLCTVQYLYGTEILPTRVRSVCYATNMAIHWLYQFAVVCVTPTLFRRLNVWGAYVFWACVCAVGLVVLGLWAPETKGVPLERMGELFKGPWYEGWRAKISPPSGDVPLSAFRRGERAS